MASTSSRSILDCVAIVSLCLGLSSACAEQKDATSTALPYTSFGPQAVAFKFLGTQWAEWQSHRGTSPTDWDVRIVVHCHASADEVALLYPDDQKANRDYRYITYDSALTYLDDVIREDFDPELTEKLRATRKEIVERLVACHE